METRTFVSLNKCGCEIDITAKWVHEPEIVNGRTLAHAFPVPYSIQLMNIVNVCDTHKLILNLPIDEASWLDTDDDGNLVQNRGYLKLPIANPTDAEKLFMHLSRYTRVAHSLDTCKCVVNRVHDRFNTDDFEIIQHNDSKKCKVHQSDDDIHSQALNENFQKNYAVGAIMEALPEIVPEDILWFFDKQRNLKISCPTADDIQKTIIQQALDTKLGSQASSQISLS